MIKAHRDLDDCRFSHLQKVAEIRGKKASWMMTSGQAPQSVRKTGRRSRAKPVGKAECGNVGQLPRNTAKYPPNNGAGRQHLVAYSFAGRMNGVYTL